ncbi:MAG: multiheme c-type cytochrome [Vicinamibacterales bacterium]
MTRRTLTTAAIAALILVALVALAIKTRGFRASSTPGALEASAARLVRDFAIPRAAKNEKNPFEGDAQAIGQGRSEYLSRCATCHGSDGRGATPIGTNLYPRVPDLRGPATQALTDGEIHYITVHGIQLTGMPALQALTGQEAQVSWALVSYLRSLRSATPAETAQQQAVASAAQYVGSGACERCHREIYGRWKTTPMANVIRDPREHPDAIIPDLATNKIAPFTLDQVAFTYGSKWKQRYFKKLGDDYFPLGAQWDVTNRVWRPYNVAPNTDWWTAHYGPTNDERPTGPLCDGCHSVNYDIKAKKPAEWNVGCESCHGPGSTHAAQPTRANIFSAARTEAIASTDTCLQCHSQGQPRNGLIDGKAYDWPVGYRVGSRLQDYWKMESHTPGETTFTHFADGTAHKNRMQGNDYVQSLMYRRGVTCASCHDSHGTEHYAQLRKPAATICLDCHAPNSSNGPQAATLEEHTHHAKGSTGSDCVACHMPKIQQTIANVNLRSHTFRFVTPAMSQQLTIPNACTACHTDKSNDWATEALRGWTGISPWRAAQ